MKCTAYFAAAILAFCAVAAPTTEATLSHGANTKDDAARELVDAFMNGTLTAADIMKGKDAIKAAQTSTELRNKNDETDQGIRAAILSLLARVTEGQINPGRYAPKEIGRRKIIHEHDKETTVSDDYKLSSIETNYQEADTIISHAKTEINSMHTESTTEKHKTIIDATDGIKGITDLPQELRDYYLDELAKLNSTSANTFDSKIANDTAAEIYSKHNVNDGTGKTEVNIHSNSSTSVKSHEEVIIDSLKPTSLDEAEVQSETEIPASSSSATESTSLKSTTTPQQTMAVYSGSVSLSVALSSATTSSIQAKNTDFLEAFSGTATYTKIAAETSSRAEATLIPTSTTTTTTFRTPLPTTAPESEEVEAEIDDDSEENTVGINSNIESEPN